MDEITAQLRDLTQRLNSVEEYQNALDTTTPSVTAEVIPSLNNFVDNADFIFPDSSYNSASYSGASTTLSDWYTRAQATSSSYTENVTGTKSGEAVDQSTTGAKWEDSTGSVLLGGGYRLAHKLSSKVANAGNYLNVRLQISKPAGVTVLDDDLILKCSIWDNTDNRIIRGSMPSLTLNKIGSHSGGTVTRDYILEVQMPDGRRFFTDTVTFASVVNTLSTSSVNRSNYVDISWSAVTGATRYRVYRKDSVDTAWHLIDTVTNGGTNVSDFGGTGGGTWTIPTLTDLNAEYQRGEVFLTSVGSALTAEDTIYEVALGFYVPSTFVVNGSQFLQIEFLKSDYSASTTSELEAYGIRIDRVGLSYTNGRWTPSPRDLTKVPTPVLPTAPLPSGGGGDSGNGGESGGGGDSSGGFEKIACVIPSTMITLWDGSEIEAGRVVVGDIVKSWDGKDHVPAVVTGITRGLASRIITFYTETSEVTCSLSHRFILDDFDLKKGTTASQMLRAMSISKISTLVDGQYGPERDKIIAYEVADAPTRVLTFKLERGKRAFLGNKFWMHNLKSDGELFF
jgi:hypothetical protein